MTLLEIVKDKNFSPTGEVHTDSKKRITLGKTIRQGNKIYQVYENSLGQLILDPMVLIPAHELWLHEAPKALKSVTNGIREASKGKLRKSPEDFSKHVGEK